MKAIIRQSLLRLARLNPFRSQKAGTCHFRIRTRANAQNTIEPLNKGKKQDNLPGLSDMAGEQKSAADGLAKGGYSSTHYTNTLKDFIKERQRNSFQVLKRLNLTNAADIVQAANKKRKK